MAEHETKDRILDAAEQLFASQGFAETSLRAITSSAEVNLAAVNYHFGSKEALIHAIFERRFGGVNRERVRLLDAYEVELGERLPRVERLVEIFIRPLGEFLRADPAVGPILSMLHGRLHAETEEERNEVLVTIFSEVFERFLRAFRRALPDAPPREIMWRQMFMVGALSFAMAKADLARHLSRGAIGPDDPEQLLDRLIVFATAGMQSALPVAAEEAGHEK